MMKTAARFAILAAMLCVAAPAWSAPPLPTINTNNVVNVTNAPYGAVGDGVTVCTTAISNAIVAAAKGGRTNGLAGGTVELPAPGIYLCGPLTLNNNINLQVDAGATLRMLPYSQYPGGITNPLNFISATGVTNLEISGSGGIDGQGAPWWPGYQTNNRPTAIVISRCSEVLLQDFVISNTPAQNISIKGNNAGNVTIQGITENSPDSAAAIPSHNTDGIDLAETNALIQNCNISVGDDNVALGSSSGLSRDILITNCAFGNGHGVSVGSITSSGVSNVTVINCTFNLTQNGIRLKSDNDRGGVTQNLLYCNLGMTNVDFPFQIYSYYNEVGTPSGISPAYAAGQAVASVITTTPVWRNISFSNIVATSVSGYPVGIIWSRTELPATNIVFDRVNLTGYGNFCLYNVNGVQFIDSSINVPATSNTFALFNTQIIVSNSVPTNTLFTCNGLTTTGDNNSFAVYDARVSLANTNVFGNGPLTLGSGIFTVSNNLSLLPATVLNFSLGTNAATVSVISNLTLGGTINVTGGNGFTNGTYTLLTCGRTLSGSLPVLGTTSVNYLCSLSNNPAGEVDLVAALPAPAAPTNLTATATNLLIDLQWDAIPGAGYNLKRGTSAGNYPTVISGLTATNYVDANVTNGVDYFYVVTAVIGGSESTNSSVASAAPLPSNQPGDLMVQAAGSELLVSWPQDHLGWQLQIQTNDADQGIGTNWVTTGNSQLTNQFYLPEDPAKGSVFLRLIYP